MTGVNTPCQSGPGSNSVVALLGARNKDTREEVSKTNILRKNIYKHIQIRGLPVKLFNPTVRALSWNIDFYLRAVPAAIYSWRVHEFMGKLPLQRAKKE